MRRGWKLALPLVLLAQFAAHGDSPPQVTLATPGSAGSNSGSGAIERFTLRFSENMVPLGDPRAQPAASSDCPVPANGRWVDQQTFVLEFDRALPGGTSCKVTLRDGLATLSGAHVQGQTSYTIDTAGPSVRAVLAPGEGSDAIDEDQVFLVATNTRADPASVAAHAACAVDGVGETSAVDILPADTADTLLTGLGDSDWHATSFLSEAEITGPDEKLPADAALRRAKLANVIALKCRRPLPPEKDMALIWPKAIADHHGKPAGRDQRFDFTVRKAFTARWECDRANGKAGCNPITPAHVRFSAPIDRGLALAVRLKLADGSERAPTVPDDNKNDAQVADLDFAGPFPAASEASLTLPAGIKDLSGRMLSNAERFPLTVRFDASPPLVKFAATFGIIEASEGAVLPVTVRAIEPQLAGRITGVAGQSAKIADDDAQIAEWLRKLDKADRDDIDYVDQPNGLSKPINHTGEKPILAPGGKPLKLDLPGKGKDFEVVGLPLSGKGFHVVELASPALGRALLGRDVPRYVSAGALVTNMAVHFKWGREGSLVWVTDLETANPVAHAAVRISDSCTGQLLASGQTSSAGLLQVESVLPEVNLGGSCEDGSAHPLMVSARANGDMSFTLSSWDKGISPFDFSLPFGFDESRDLIHTVFDRALVRVGETMHFKHILRHPAGSGFDFAKGFSGKLIIAHQGSETKFEQAVEIGANGSAEGEWTVPQGAPLGDYSLRFEAEGRSIWSSQTIRVDEYKLPTMRATITGPGEALVQPASVPLSLFVGYLSGGGAGQLPVTLRTQFNLWSPTPKGWDGFTFGGDEVVEGTRPLSGEGDEPAPPPLPYAQTLPATLGADGSAKSEISVGQKLSRPVNLTVEMDYPDASGETMTASRSIMLYPSALQVGIKTDGWLMRGDDVRFQLAVLDLKGQPVAGAPVTVKLYSREVVTARRRLIGGFYAYDNQEKITRLAGGCIGRSDALGRTHCQLAPGVSGEVTAVATVKDGEGREARAVQTVWLAGEDDWWFGGDNGDRMDVIAEQAGYKSGDTAKFQVRMPFREATALVTVEREGVLSSFVTHLSGKDPEVSVPMPAAYAPNVFVSVMAVRGRVSGTRLWLEDLAKRWNLPFGQGEATSASATVDLAKPAYRIGYAKVLVGWEGHRLDVSIKADRDKYAVRDKAQVSLAVRDPSGQPARGADVAFVAVDEALLQLMPNPSWDVLKAMMSERSLEVATSTAQMQVVGKRHFGKKAVAAGGGGGDASAVNRENFQPVLLWQGHVPLDGNGQAKVAVPLSDALSRFRLVAVATDGAQLFGMGETSVRTAQDLAAYPGLPTLVRTGDRYEAVFTLHNGSDHAMSVTAQPVIEPAIASLPPLTISIPAGAAGRVRWGVNAPGQAGTLKWTLKASTSDGKARDTVTATQEVAPAVPVEAWAASLLRVGDPSPVIAPPMGALVGGYVDVSFSNSLAAPLDGVRAYMGDYPYNCLEQRLSRVIVQNDLAGWNALSAALPTYMDGQGLLRYWPDEHLPGDPVLTSYVLAASSAAGLALPDAVRERMVAGLQGVVEGRSKSVFPITVDDRLLRIYSLSAMARVGAATPALVARIDMVPADMSTSSLAQWIVALDRVQGVPNAAQMRAAAEGELRRRLVYEGTRLDLADRDNAPWWMMASTDEMAILALDAVIGKPGWANEVPKMMVGVGARQMRGHWDTTPANAWGTIVSRRFDAAYPASAVAGVTHVALGAGSANVSWPIKAGAPPVRLPLVAAPMLLSQSGGAGPWATVTVRAAVPLTAPLMAGYRLSREVSVVSARDKSRLSQGDVIRVRLTIEAGAERNWVALSDPLPPGAVVLSGLGGESAILQQGEQSEGTAPSYTEGGRDAWRAYFQWLPRGRHVLEYTLRLNTAGRFTMPPARVEAMYAPAIRAQLPVPPVTVWSF